MKEFSDFLSQLDISQDQAEGILNFAKENCLSYNLYKKVYENISEMVIIHDNRLKVVDFKGFNGETACFDQIIGKDLSEIIQVGDFNDYLVKIRKLQEDKRIFSKGLYLLGELEFPVSFNVSKHISEETFYVLIAEKTADAIVKKQNYRELVENIFDVICRYTPEGIIKYISPQIEKYGYTQDYLIGKNIIEFIHEDDIQNALADIQTTLRTQITFPASYRFKRGDGSYLFFEEMSSAKIQDGRIVEFTAIIRDVTERMLSEEALFEAEEKYRSMFEHIIDVYFRTDDQGRLTLVSPSGTRLFGYETTMEMLGKCITEDFFYEQIDPIALVNRIRRNGPVTNIEVALKTKNGDKIFCEVNSQPIYDKKNSFLGLEGMIRDISDRKKTLERMQDSEKRFVELVEMLPQIVFELTPKGYFTFVNQTAVDKTGFSRDELLHDFDFYNLIAPKDIAKMQVNFRKAMMGIIVENNEYQIMKKDGTSFPALVYSTPIIKDGETAGIRGIVIDISNRKKIESQLKESEIRYRELTELLPQTIFEIDEEGFITFLNESGFKLLGLTAEQLVHRVHVKEVIAPDELEFLNRRILEIMKGDKAVAREYHLKKASGDYVPVMIYSSPIINDGHFAGLRGIAVDITELKNQEDRLNTSRKRLELALEGVNEGLWDWNIETGYTFYSDVWAQILGYSHEEIEPHFRSWEKRIHPDDREMVMNTLEAHLKGHTDAYQAEFRMETGKGDFKWINSRGRVVERDKDGKALRAIGTQLDITEERQIQEKLKEADKMESLVRLAGGVAEDLNDILFGMISYPDLILLKLSEDSPLKKYVEKIKESSLRARRIIQDLLALSSQEELNKISMNINDLIYDFIHSVEFENIKNANPEIDFRIHPGKNITQTDISEPHIFKCIINLMKYAASSLPYGGEVQLSSSMRVIESENNLSWQIRSGKYVVLSILDSSGGISQQDATRIFEPFYTSDVLKREGTGLGLAIVWSIVKDHDGHIEVTNQEGKGTNISIFLYATNQNL